MMIPLVEARPAAALIDGATVTAKAVALVPAAGWLIVKDLVLPMPVQHDDIVVPLGIFVTFTPEMNSPLRELEKVELVPTVS